ARQLRLRDMGGLVVIDIIDMQAQRNQREVENRMHDAQTVDRARVQIGRLSPLGLLEMSRQRLRPSLGDTHSIMCPRCSGVGTIRSTRSLALSILRLVEDEAQKERSAEIRAICPVSVATYLLNEKRKTISSIESRNNTRVVIVPSAELMTPHFEVQRLRDDDEGTLETSYKIVAHTDETKTDEEDFKAKPISAPKPLVQLSGPSQPAPEPVKKPVLLSRLINSNGSIFGGSKIEENKGKREHVRDNLRNPGRNNRRDGRNNRRDKDRKEDREILDNLEHRTNGDTKQTREQDKRDNGRDSERRDSIAREANNEQRRSRNHRDQQRGDATREPQAGDEEQRQPRNRNQRPERDNRRQPAREETLAAPEALPLESQDNQDDGDERPSKRPAGRRTRSQQRRRSRGQEADSAVSQDEEATASEPKVLSESAQLAQQISAAIAEHAQHAQKVQEVSVEAETPSQFAETEIEPAAAESNSPAIIAPQEAIAESAHAENAQAEPAVQAESGAIVTSTAATQPKEEQPAQSDEPQAN